MKGTPIVGRRYVGRSNSERGFTPPFRGVCRIVSAQRAFIVGDGTIQGFWFNNEQLKPLVPLKSPPTPPEGWAYQPKSNKVIRRNLKHDYLAGWVNYDGTVDTCRGFWSPDELVTVAKFLRRLAKWHACQEKTK